MRVFDFRVQKVVNTESCTVPDRECSRELLFAIVFPE